MCSCVEFSGILIDCQFRWSHSHFTLMQSSSNHSYISIGFAYDRSRYRDKVKSCASCVSLIFLLGILLVISLHKIHAIHFHKKSISQEGDFQINCTDICMGYPTKAAFSGSNRHVYIHSKEHFVKVKKYIMKPCVGSASHVTYSLLVDEYFQKNHSFEKYHNIFVHRYLLSSMLPRGNCVTEIVFMNFNCSSSVYPFRLTVDNFWMLDLWSYPNQYAMQERLNGVNIQSKGLEKAIMRYFEVLQSFGTILQFKPLSQYDIVRSNYSFCPTEAQFVGFSIIGSTIYKGINSETKKPCLQRISLAHAYLTDSRNQQLLGMIAVADSREMELSLRQCNSFGTVDFAAEAMLNYSDSAQHLLSSSPNLVGNCTCGIAAP